MQRDFNALCTLQPLEPTWRSFSCVQRMGWHKAVMSSAAGGTGVQVLGLGWMEEEEGFGASNLEQK